MRYLLTSFPKSGNTWVSFIIANTYNQLVGQFDEIDFHNIHHVNPELKKGEQQEPLFKELPRVFTTHSRFQEAFKNVILIIRNPWDVMYSYFHYLRGERLKDITLPELIFHEEKGVRSLVEHNQSYIRNCNNLLIITYERLHANPAREVEKIVDFLKLPVDEKIVNIAIEKSSFETMRHIEVKKGRKYGNPGFLFTRSGQIGEGKHAIQQEKDLDRYILTEIKQSPLLNLLYG